MSIDRRVSALVDTYRNNPNELKKKYSMSKDTIELIALQQIKNDLDEKNKSIALAMQNNPSTIKSQLENEVFTRTAQDVARQVGGALKNKAAQQQKGLNRLAQRAAAPKGPQGLGALMPQQGQRSQTRMMKSGGIVAFNEGNLVETPASLNDLPNKGVTQEQLRDVMVAQIKQLLEGGVSPQTIKEELDPQYAGLVDEVVQTVQTTPSSPEKEAQEAREEGVRKNLGLPSIQAEQEREEKRQRVAQNVPEVPLYAKDLPKRRVPLDLNAGIDEETAEILFQQGSEPKKPEEPFTPSMEQPSRASRDVQRDLDASRQTLADLGIASVKAPQPTPTGGVADAVSGGQQFPALVDAEGNRKPTTQLVTEMGPLRPPKMDFSTAADEGLELARQYGMGPEQIPNPLETRKKVRDDEADFFRRQEKRDAFQKLIDERVGLEAIQEDPAKLRRERLMATLRGGARGRGQAAGARADTIALQDERKRKAIDTRFNMLKELETQDMQVAQYASQAGREAMQEVAAMRRVAFDSVKSMRNQDIQRILEEGRQYYAANADNIKNLIDASTADATRELKLAIQEGNDMQRLLGLSAQVVKIKEQVIDAVTNREQNSFVYENAKATLAKGNATAQQIANAEKIIADTEKAIAIKVETIFEESGLSDLDLQVRSALSGGIDTSAMARAASAAMQGQPTGQGQGQGQPTGQGQPDLSGWGQVRIKP